MNFLDIAQAVVAVLIIIAIMVQNRGTGMGATFGGEGTIYRTKRGVEKKVFTATIILSILFLVIALLNVIY